MNESNESRAGGSVATGLSAAAIRASSALRRADARWPAGRKCVFVAVMAVSAWAAAGALGSLLQASAQDAWPSVPGVILMSEIRPCEDESFAATVRYRYDIAGSVNVSDRISANGSECGSRRFAERAAARWKVDQRVVVRFDASSRSRPILEVDPHRLGAAIGLTLSVLVFACAVFGALTPFLRRRSQTSDIDNG